MHLEAARARRARRNDRPSALHVGPFRQWRVGAGPGDRRAHGARAEGRRLRLRQAASGLQSSFDAVAATAREVGIPFAGHVSDDVGVRRALAAKQSAIDHLDGYVQALAREGCIDDEIRAGFFGIALTDCADESRIPELVAATKAAGTWMAPTQVLIEQRAEHQPQPGCARGPPRATSRRATPQRGSARGRDLGTAAPVAERFVSRSVASCCAGCTRPACPSCSPPTRRRCSTCLATGRSRSSKSVRQDRPTGAGRARDRHRERREISARKHASGACAKVSPRTSCCSRPIRANLANVRKLDGVMLRGRWLPRGELDELLRRRRRTSGQRHQGR